MNPFPQSRLARAGAGEPTAPARLQARYGYRPVLLETFVEKPRFTGTCCKAANWQYLGDTQGRGKLDTFRRHGEPVKGIWVYPLADDFRRHLCTGASAA